MIQTKIIGDNSIAAITFGDQKAAAEILNALKVASNIVHAVIYTADGAVFAAFHREDVRGSFFLPNLPQDDICRFGRKYLDVFQRIVFDNEAIGAIYIQSDLKKLYVTLIWYSGVVGIVIVVSLGIAFLLISRLQQAVTKPILLLRKATAKSVHGDFMVKAEIISKDEIGQLAVDFNKMTEDLHKTYEQLVHTEKLGAIGRLSASIAHEINNPIYGIYSVLERIRDKALLDDGNKEYVDMALRECNRITDLVKKLQDFNKPSSGVITAVDIHSIIDEMLMLSRKRLRSEGLR